MAQHLPSGGLHILFSVANRHVITVTLSLALSIDSTIRFALDFILEQDVQGYTDYLC